MIGIELTDEMIEAGADKLELIGVGAYKELAKEVFLAMIELADYDCGCVEQQNRE